MSDKRVFIDTNIFIYALTQPKDKHELFKHDKSIELLKNILHDDKTIIVSLQVLNELHINMLKKFKIADEIVLNTIKETLLDIAKVVGLEYSTYHFAFDMRQKYNLSYWDSLVIASALEHHCTTLYSEDMQHNQIIEKQLKIVNPLK